MRGWYGTAAMVFATVACGEEVRGGIAGTGGGDAMIGDTGLDAPDATEPLDSAFDEPATEDAMPDHPEDSGAKPTISLLSLNLHCLKLDGTPFTDHGARFDAIASAAAAEGVHVIAAQEVCKSADLDALELLREALEARTAAAWTATYEYAHKAWEGTPDEADEGVALFVRGPLADVHAIEYAVQTGLRRVALVGRLPDALGGFWLASVHLDHADPAARLAQARETASLALAIADPSVDVLMAGDFNALPGSPAIDAAADFGFRELTSPLGAGRIDHVLAHRAAAWAVEETRMVFDGTDYPSVSDHPGILVRVTPSAGEATAITRLRATVQLGIGDYLTVRGDASPLTWDFGWPAWQEPSGAWKVVLTEVPAGSPFHYKFLRSDQDWQLGDDAIATGGEDYTSSPSF